MKGEQDKTSEVLTGWEKDDSAQASIGDPFRPSQLSQCFMASGGSDKEEVSATPQLGLFGDLSEGPERHQ